MARLQNDIALDGNKTLRVANGDFVITESTAEHQTQLIINAKGDFKENPLVCIGAFGYLNDEDDGGLLRETSRQFAMDGMDVSSVTKKGTVIKTEAVYK